MSVTLKMPFESILLTPERSVPSSPSLSAAVVTHTNATTNHLHTNDPSAVDFVELTRLLQNVASRTHKRMYKKNTTTTTTTTTSSSSSSSLCSSASIQKSCINTSTPPQFIFKKPLYNQYYHQTHFHHSSGALTPIQSNTQVNTPFNDLKRFFVNSLNEPSFANQFKQNISSRYGQWGKREAFCGIFFFIKEKKNINSITFLR